MSMGKKGGVPPTSLSHQQSKETGVNELMVACLCDSATRVREAINEMTRDGKKVKDSVLKIAMQVTTKLGHDEATIALMESLPNIKSELTIGGQSIFESAVLLKNWNMANALLDVAQESGLNLRAIFADRRTQGLGNILGLATWRHRLGYSDEQQALIDRLIDIGADCRIGEIEYGTDEETDDDLESSLCEEEDPLQNAIHANSLLVVERLLKEVPGITEQSFEAATKVADNICYRSKEIRNHVTRRVVETKRLQQTKGLKRKADFEPDGMRKRDGPVFSFLNSHLENRAYCSQN